jgi:site-specific DNA-cytosine methylase
LPESDNKAYEALGNAINVEVAKLVAKALVGYAINVNADAQSINRNSVLAEK